MQKELLTNEQLRLAVEKKWIEHIKLCQDNFIYFVKEVWLILYVDWILILKSGATINI